MKFDGSALSKAGCVCGIFITLVACLAQEKEEHG